MNTSKNKYSIKQFSIALNYFTLSLEIFKLFNFKLRDICFIAFNIADIDKAQSEFQLFHVLRTKIVENKFCSIYKF